MARELPDIVKGPALTETLGNEWREQERKENLSEAEKSHRIELAAKKSEMEVARVVGEGNKQSSCFLEKAKKLGISRNVVTEALGSESENIRRLSKMRNTVAGKSIAKVMALMFGVGGSGVPGTAKAVEIGMNNEVTVAAGKTVEGVSNLSLETAKRKMMPETREDAARIGMNFLEEGEIVERAEGATEDIVKRLEAQSEALKREIAENGAEEAAEDPEEREERMDEERDTRENGKADENERRLMQERLDRETPKLETSSEIIEYLAKLARDDSRETIILSAEMPDGKVVVLSANPTEEKSGGALKVDKDTVDVFFKKNDAHIFYIDHNHPKKAAELFDEKNACDSCAHIPYTEEYAAPPSATDFKSSSLSHIIEEESRGGLTFKYRVATDKGVWEFSARKGDSVGFDKVERLMLDAMRNAQLDDGIAVEDRENTESDELRLKAIREVGVDKIKQLNEDTKKNTEEYTRRQVLTENSDPSIRGFIRYLDGKGLDATFIPLKEGKLDLSRKIDVGGWYATGWGDK